MYTFKIFLQMAAGRLLRGRGSVWLPGPRSLFEGSDLSHAFPIVRAGGLFIFIMGVGVILGGVFSGQRKLLLSLGGVTATMAIILFAHELTRPLGLPTNMQVGPYVAQCF